jgi:gag-polypeptide of LTR copia-type/Zinc knuckle
MKAEVFAAAKGFKKAMMEDRVKEEWADKEKLTEEEAAIMKQDADAKQFLILSCSGNALDIIASHETAFGMYQALKSRYDSKKTKDLVKATTKLEKCYMKSDTDDPYLWIVEMERLNREVGKCENGMKRSDEQMKATILARLPKRRYESVIASLNGKMGASDLTFQDFVGEIVNHFELFVEPAKNRMEQQGSGKHMALNTTTGKGGWKAFKGTCNKCGKQGHKARDCNTGGETKNTNSNKKFSGKCFKCGDSGHMARDCKKTTYGERGMFVGMSVGGSKMQDRQQVSQTEQVDLNKVAMDILHSIAQANKEKEGALEIAKTDHAYMKKIAAIEEQRVRLEIAERYKEDGYQRYICQEAQD